MNYYNEHDPKAAAWLRALIESGHIAPGIVDTRSISDVLPDELTDYAQCHFFAGIGGWSLALRYAEWPDTQPIWTGSCPCQPFSCAGKRRGESDSRHLWPAFRRLITQCRPSTVFGEQVASALGREWLSGVRSDMEDLGYAVGAADLCAASVGAPHRRQRLFWVADANGRIAFNEGIQRGREHGQFAQNREPLPVAYPEHNEWRSDEPQGGSQGQETNQWACGVGYTESGGRGECRDAAQSGNSGHVVRPSWAEFDVIDCRDGKARRVEAGTFPLAHGIPGRMGLLRGYGNAIVPQVAEAFIRAWMECRESA